MAQFISFDDGRSYVNADKIDYFIWEARVGGGGNATVFYMKDGSTYATSRPISEVADMLKAVNIWY